MVSKKKGVRSSHASPQKKKDNPQAEVLSKVPSASTLVDSSKESSKDISILKLVNYNMLFFIPVLVGMLFALKIGAVYSDYFEASPSITSKIFMVPFMMLIFLLIIPFIRKREKIAGIRYSILAFLIVGIGITLPSALKGQFGLLFSLPNYFASYILLTFFFCPEVLGIERNLRDWFEHGKQFVVVAIYVSIVMLYVVGFGFIFYEIHNDPANPGAFSVASQAKTPTVATFVYYSMVSFTTTGYGDIIPISTAARLLFFIESMVGMIVNVLFIAILLLFVSNAEFLSHRAEDQELKEIRKVEKEERSIMTEVKKEERELKKEEHELKKEERELKHMERKVEVVEEKENLLFRVLRKIRDW